MKKIVCFAIACIAIVVLNCSAVSEYSPIHFGTGNDATDSGGSFDDSPEYDMLIEARARVKDEDHYWKVTVDKVDCNYDLSSDEDDARIVNIDLTWDGMNGVPRTKTMLRLFGDDLAQTLFKKFHDLNITQLWCRWAVPYLYDDDGFIAKYKYQKIGDAVYMTDSNGLLFNLPDDYK